METQQVKIRMFGSFEVEYDGKVITEADNRSAKLWLLLAYLICNRHKPITQKMLLEDLWNSDSTETNVLKATLHRLRQMLSEHFGEEFGHGFIVCQKKIYSIAEEYELLCDFEQFDLLHKQTKKVKSDDEKFSLYREMFELYRGEILEDFSDASWMMSWSVQYRSVYLELIQNILEICERQQRYKEALEILSRAGEVMKYEESIYVPLIRILVRMGKYADAIQVYGRLNDMLSVTYGVKPSKEAKNLYNEALYALNTQKVSIKELPELLMQEEDRGALYYDFDMFKSLCQAYRRGAERNENDICIGLMDITDVQDMLLPKRSLTVCVVNLKELLCSNLRSGDVVSMCTGSQFVLLLQNVEKENAEKVMERIKHLFYKQYPHTPAKLSCYVTVMTEWEK